MNLNIALGVDCLYVIFINDGIHCCQYKTPVGFQLTWLTSFTNTSNIPLSVTNSFTK